MFHHASWIIFGLYLVSMCPVYMAEKITCTKTPVPHNSRQESLKRLKKQVDIVTDITDKLVAPELEDRHISTYAKTGFCSEETQNVDRQYLADNPVKLRDKPDSQNALNSIKPLIDDIKAQFQLLRDTPTREKAKDVGGKVRDIRAKAVYFNKKLMTNAGYVGP